MVHLKRRMFKVFIVYILGWFKLDVNKTNKIIDWFINLHWIPTNSKIWADQMSERIAN